MNTAEQLRNNVKAKQQKLQDDIDNVNKAIEDAKALRLERITENVPHYVNVIIFKCKNNSLKGITEHFEGYWEHEDQYHVAELITESLKHQGFVVDYSKYNVQEWYEDGWLMHKGGGRKTLKISW